jgi:hypothetical protein
LGFSWLTLGSEAASGSGFGPLTFGLQTPVPALNFQQAVFAQPVRYVQPGKAVPAGTEGEQPFFEQQTPEVNGPPLGRYGLPYPETSSWLSDDMAKWVDPYGMTPAVNLAQVVGPSDFAPYSATPDPRQVPNWSQGRGRLDYQSTRLVG